jgi:cell division protein FtsI (penicillin-binding protein 3)
MKGGHFGHVASAPVFQDLAQQILEYLGVPHDQDLKPVKETAKNAKPPKEADPEEHPEDLNALFAEVNNLPPDDPLRHPANQGTPPDATAVTSASKDASPSNSGDQPIPSTVSDSAPPPVSQPAEPSPGAAHGSVTVASQRVAVPSFTGKSLREVVELASRSGLGVQIVGTGLGHDQAPAAGTMVPAGTEVIVRFAQ